jgi:hypothetical protein
LFHPRTDPWADHFEWSRLQRGELTGRISIGRATIAALRINDAGMIELRRLLTDAGLFPEVQLGDQPVQE